MGPPYAAIHDLSRSLTPLSSIADSNDEVDRLLTGPVTPERSLADDRADEESDLSPLTSSDEETEDIDTTPRTMKGTRTLRPRGARALTLTVELSTPNTQTLSRPGKSSSVEQPSGKSKKRKRTESLTAETSHKTQKQRPKLDVYVSEDRCHQCRNRPRYAFMRCTSKVGSSESCKRLFCVSCITKRYPDDINFNPRLKKWKCPFCEDTCNCTKCCFKRNVRYTSTASVRIDQDMVLHYATLMPNNLNSKKRPPLQKSSKSTQKLKSARRPVREPAKTRTAVAPPERIPNVALNAATARDIESIIRGLADTAAMFEKFGCVSGEYWGVVFSNIDGGRIGVAYVGDKLPEIFILKDEGDGDLVDEPPPPPAKRLRVSSRAST
ncbi:hypothetical protein BDM02DRAFT_981282 [Thelephora ganbajun]|uniref:Uncharacterized protein n=1 Tax=Thelephora ganbajun TaxID=370292 RepID=A0ACB6Z4A1_THEGA|nr:hypothetical protein BDM02DRAFT_981282 [Thelephora ganbajun]